MIFINWNTILLFFVLLIVCEDIGIILPKAETASIMSSEVIQK